MSDMSFEEKKAKRTGLKRRLQSRASAVMLAKHVLKNVTVPDSGKPTLLYLLLNTNQVCFKLTIQSIFHQSKIK